MRTIKQEYQANPKPNIHIPETPRRLHTVPHCANPECRISFTTYYTQQIFCNAPCKAMPSKKKAVVAKPKLSKAEQSKIDRDRRKELEKERTDFTLLQRKLFARRM